MARFLLEGLPSLLPLWSSASMVVDGCLAAKSCMLLVAVGKVGWKGGWKLGVEGRKWWRLGVFMRLGRRQRLG